MKAIKKDLSILVFKPTFSWFPDQGLRPDYFESPLLIRSPKLGCLAR